MRTKTTQQNNPSVRVCMRDRDNRRACACQSDEGSVERVLKNSDLFRHTSRGAARDARAPPGGGIPARMRRSAAPPPPRAAGTGAVAAPEASVNTHV